MDGEYRSLNNSNIDLKLLFYGQENCAPGYFFQGNNIRENYVIHYIKSGKGTFSSSGQQAQKLKAGDLFVLPRGVPCFYQADLHDPWSYFWIGISGIQIQRVMKNSRLSEKYYLRQVQDSNFYANLKRLFVSLHSRESLANDMLTETLLYQCFYDLLTEYPHVKKAQRRHNDEYFTSALTYLEDNFADPNCTIDNLCKQLELSRSYIYKVFKENTALSPQQFLINLRMKQAKELLTNSNMTLQNIAHFVGYVDPFTFSKAFKRYQGISPNNYRKIKNTGID